MKFCKHSLKSLIISVKSKICVKKDDQYVSKMIQKEGAWEEKNVLLVLKAMSLYKDAVFVGKLEVEEPLT